MLRLRLNREIEGALLPAALGGDKPGWEQKSCERRGGRVLRMTEMGGRKALPVRARQWERKERASCKGVTQAGSGDAHHPPPTPLPREGYGE